MMGTQPFNWENKSKSSHSHKLFLFPQKLYVYSKYIRSNYVIYYQQNLSFRCRNNGSPPFVVGYTGVSCCPVQDDVNINLREGRWASLEPNVSHFVCIEEIMVCAGEFRYPQGSESPGPGVAGDWELPCVGIGTE
ncbi:rCG22545 [Rattus norvegicus]|uniref:RCG22545 n=1 Tax=Rattus norvegicus TaxID=10116 RepID=A6IPF3_RAT|nr:rCG22545 [Rattus norvegicus]